MWAKLSLVSKGRALGAVLALSCLILYDPTRMENTTGDTISARYWPVAILTQGTWKLNAFGDMIEKVRYFAVFTATGNWYPRAGWGIGVFSIPFYALAHVTGLGGDTWDDERVNRVSRWNAIAIATGSVLLCFWFLRLFAPLWPAFWSSALFAFGSWNWSMGPQGLYTQSATVFMHWVSLIFIWKLFSMKRGDKRAWRITAFLGLFHAIIWSMRPSDLLLIFPVALLLQRRRLWLPYALAVAAYAVPLMLAYKATYGYYLGFYEFIEAVGGLVTWRLDFLSGFFGLLASPNRGVIVFMPLLIAVPFLWKRYASKSCFPEGFSRYLGLSLLLYFTSLCFLDYWHGTWSYGSRYLYDLLPYVWPVLTLALTDAWRTLIKGKVTTLSKPVAIVLLLFAIQGVFIHGLGHRNYDLYVWNYQKDGVTDATVWRFKPWMIASVWNAGSNHDRWPSARERLLTHGF